MDSGAVNISAVVSRIEGLCSRRECCSKDIREKLLKKGISREKADEIVEKLVEQRFIDDRRYAVAFSRDKSSLSGWGVKKIEFQLKLKGILPADIKEALQEVDDRKARGRMEEIIERKWRELEREKELHTRRMKTIRFALGRGYTYEEVSQFVKNLK